MTLPRTLRSPATGRLAARHTKDALLGLYQLTQRAPGPARRDLRDLAEAELAVFHGHLYWTDPCLVQLGGKRRYATPGQARVWQLVYEHTASGARATAAQVTQLSSLRGHMARADGSTFPTPITSNFRRGLSPTEYFISAHGARKGTADTALRTAHAGHLTRRLVYALQGWTVTELDCGDAEGLPEHPPQPGRTALSGGRVRSPMTCRAACTGAHLSTLTPGYPAGLIAAQSLGEPATQLTMRTFHTGGVAAPDITHGLPALTRLLDAPHADPHALARQLHALYQQQGVTLHPVHTELTARALHATGLRRAPAGHGFLTQAAFGRTVPTGVTLVPGQRPSRAQPTTDRTRRPAPDPEPDPPSRAEPAPARTRRRAPSDPAPAAQTSARRPGPSLTLSPTKPPHVLPEGARP